MTDGYDLQRFVVAQDPVYADAIGMLRRGTMRAPYVEIIFPRLMCGPHDPAAHVCNIRSLDEAHAYLSSRLLGGRYRECVGLLQRLADVGVHAVFSRTDARKLHASLTLFSAVSDDEFLLETMFDVWFGGVVDEETMKTIRQLAP